MNIIRFNHELETNMEGLNKLSKSIIEQKKFVIRGFKNAERIAEGKYKIILDLELEE